MNHSITYCSFNVAILWENISQITLVQYIRLWDPMFLCTSSSNEIYSTCKTQLVLMLIRWSWRWMWGSIARLRNRKPCRRLAKPAILPTTKSKSGWNRVYLHFYGFWWYRLKITKSINWIWIMKWMLRYSGMCGFLYSEQETRAYQGSERGCKWSYLSSEDPFWINSKIWGGVSNSSHHSFYRSTGWRSNERQCFFSCGVFAPLNISCELSFSFRNAYNVLYCLLPVDASGFFLSSRQERSNCWASNG